MIPYNLLKKYFFCLFDDWKSAKEVIEETDMSQSTTFRNLQLLHKMGFLRCCKDPKEGNIKRYTMVFGYTLNTFIEDFYNKGGD